MEEDEMRPRLKPGSRPTQPPRICSDCGDLFESLAKVQIYCYDCKNARQRRRYLAIKREAFAAYGGLRCACCGEDTFEFLTLDHVKGGGTAHREALQSLHGYRVAGWRYIELLKKKGFPPGYRVLCFNCNCAMGSYGECPHEKRKARATSGDQQSTHS
jgi:hypothetical protein